MYEYVFCVWSFKWPGLLISLLNAVHKSHKLYAFIMRLNETLCRLHREGERERDRKRSQMQQKNGFHLLFVAKVFISIVLFASFFRVFVVDINGVPHAR